MAGAGGGEPALWKLPGRHTVSTTLIQENEARSTTGGCQKQSVPLGTQTSEHSQVKRGWGVHQQRGPRCRGRLGAAQLPGEAEGVHGWSRVCETVGDAVEAAVARGFGWDRAGASIIF